MLPVLIKKIYSYTKYATTKYFHHVTKYAKDGSAGFELLAIQFTIPFCFFYNTRRWFWTEFLGFSFIFSFVKNMQNS
jgi:hypothetical protein